MLPSELKLNKLYKLNLSDNLEILSDPQSTQIVITGSDGIIASGDFSVFPISNIDYLDFNGGTLSFDNVGDVLAGTITGATHILYYFTAVNTDDCTTLAQYSEDISTGNLSNVIKISYTDYNTILNAYPNSITISTGATATYDPKAIYLISDDPTGKKYKHNIRLTVQPSSLSGVTTFLQFSFINNTSTPYANSSTGNRALAQALYDVGFTSDTRICPATGYANSGSNKMCSVIGVYGYPSSGSAAGVGYKYIQLGYNSGNVLTIYQYVNAGSSTPSTYDSTYSSLYDTVEVI